MFVVEVSERDGPRTRLVFDKPEITFGRLKGNDVVLPLGSVSSRHARCVCRDGKLILVDLKSTNGTYVDGRRITAPHVLAEGARVYIGDFTLWLAAPDEFEDEGTRPVPATELRLLAAVAQREAGSRLVYADWLEEQGDAARAEFLRLQEALVGATPGSPDFEARTARLRELATDLGLRWRYKVARPVIEKCLAVEFECPKEWGSLDATERPEIRHCSACSRRVVYCATVAEARHFASAGECVAVDALESRYANDLEPRRMVMGRMVAPPHR